MKKSIFYFFIISFLMSSCYPDKPVSYDDMDLVYTNYEETYDFSSKGTYAMPDKIVKITGNLSEGDSPEFVKEPYNTQILQKIENNMAALGWTKAETPENADITFFPAVWTNTTVVYWYDYWCWYYYYYCGWGYPVSSVTSYTTGTLVMTMIVSDEEYVEPAIVWEGIANGLLSGSYDISRVNNIIDRAFEQSPYLKANE